MQIIDFLALLGVALFLAKVFGGLAEKIGISSALSELLVGVILGNLGISGLEVLGDSQLVHSLSELGVLFLLFLVGLETDLKALRQVGLDALMVATIGVVVPAALAFIVLPQVGNFSF